MPTLSKPQSNKKILKKNYTFFLLFISVFIFFSNIKMNSSFSLQQIHKTSNLDFELISRHYILVLMAKLMQNNFQKPKMKQSEITDHLHYLSSILDRYKNHINMVLPHRLQPFINKKQSETVSNTNIDTNSHREHELKQPEMTSNDLKRPQMIPKLNLLKVKTNRKVGQTPKLPMNILMKFSIKIFYKGNWQCNLFLITEQ